MDFNSSLAQIKKDQPGVADVHVPSAGGDGKKKKVQKDFEFKIPISKTEIRKVKDQPDQNLVFGWASVINKDGEWVIDTQGDRISEADMETAFYDFVKSARNAGEMHAGYGDGFGTCVECMVFTKAKQEIMKIDLGFVGTWVGFEVTPELFAKVKSGDYPAFSIGGSGIRIADA